MKVRQADNIASVTITFEEADKVNMHMEAGADPVVEMPTGSAENLVRALMQALEIKEMPEQEVKF